MNQHSGPDTADNVPVNTFKVVLILMCNTAVSIKNGFAEEGIESATSSDL